MQDFWCDCPIVDSNIPEDTPWLDTRRIGTEGTPCCVPAGWPLVPLVCAVGTSFVIYTRAKRQCIVKNLEAPRRGKG